MAQNMAHKIWPIKYGTNMAHKTWPIKYGTNMAQTWHKHGTKHGT